MNDLTITPSKQNPDLRFSTSGDLTIAGQSLPESATLLYGSVLEWIEEYSKNPAAKTTLEFKMRYYNTASSKMFFNIIKRMNQLSKTGANVEIHWYYQQDDEDMLDQGEYFRDLVDLPFKFFPLEN